MLSLIQKSNFKFPFQKIPSLQKIPSSWFSSLKFNENEIMKQKCKSIDYFSKEKKLKVTFDDKTELEIPAELLRAIPPQTEEKQLIPGRKFVSVMSISLVGNYAAKFEFDDMSENIISFHYLFWLGKNQKELFKDYEEKLKEKKLSRDPKENKSNRSIIL
ncbi:hypothetical protein M0811_01345 [Anaeramoeba ignava]|uniref:Gamma-butyrobetaine hydroxylase-like N-terminal domain-containing protein n=1 Tax=Anaeramoeba ignava TaxID=1746090 RepID=A0A9Q0LGL9_ANAIG|nr:hypothetical protein M0811_01345 [Anaeramoeba ignava]